MFQYTLRQKAAKGNQNIFFKTFNCCGNTAVSAGHQIKSCSVYEKCEDIFFPETTFVELNMFYKKSSETVKN